MIRDSGGLDGIFILIGILICWLCITVYVTQSNVDLVNVDEFGTLLCESEGLGYAGYEWLPTNDDVPVIICGDKNQVVKTTIETQAGVEDLKKVSDLDNSIGDFTDCKELNAKRTILAYNVSSNSYYELKVDFIKAWDCP